MDTPNIIHGLFVEDSNDKTDKNGWDDSFNADTAAPTEIAKWFAERGYPVDRGDKFLGGRNLYSPEGVRSLSHEEEQEGKETFGQIFDKWCRPRLDKVQGRLITARAAVREASQDVKNITYALAQIESQIDNPDYDSEKKNWTIVEALQALLWAGVCIITLYASSVILGDMLEVMQFGSDENTAHAYWTGMTILIAATFSSKAFHMTRKTPEERSRFLTALIVISGAAAFLWFALFAADYGGIARAGRGLNSEALISKIALEATRQVVQLVGDSLFGAFSFILLTDALTRFGLMRPPKIANPAYLEKKGELDRATKEAAKHEAFVHELGSLDTSFTNAKDEFIARCLDQLKKCHIENSLPSDPQPLASYNLKVGE